MGLKQKEQLDGFSGIGTVTIRPFKIGENGVKHYESFTKNNLIVEAGRATLIDLLVGDKKKQLKYIRWGKGGALQFPDGDPLNPLVVDDSDEDVSTFLLDKPLRPHKRLAPQEACSYASRICRNVNL
jgi:hypothetical protein